MLRVFAILALILHLDISPRLVQSTVLFPYLIPIRLYPCYKFWHKGVFRLSEYHAFPSLFYFQALSHE